MFFIYFCARDTSEAGNKPFGTGVNRIDRGFHHDSATARCDVKSKKSFIVGDVWHKPHRELGDLAEARLFAFPRGSV
jgi:hypothetical protein